MMGNTHHTVSVTVPAPYLVLHKVGAGNVELEQNLNISNVNVPKISLEYFRLWHYHLNDQHVLKNIRNRLNICTEYFTRIFVFPNIRMTYLCKS